MPYQYLKTKILNINASNEKEAINLALSYAPNIAFWENSLLNEFSEEKLSHYSKPPSSYKLKNDENKNTNNTHGYFIEVTSIDWSEKEKNHEYIITNCIKNDKPYLYAHLETNNCSIMSLILYSHIQKKKTAPFQPEQALNYIKHKYDLSLSDDNHLLSLIDFTFNTPSTINKNTPYEVILIRGTPDKSADFFGILFISEKNNNNIIINEIMKEHIIKNEHLQKFIIEYEHNILNKNIQSKSYNKKSLKI